ncbi:hypothetical protein [Streptomyces spiralis]
MKVDVPFAALFVVSEQVAVPPGGLWSRLGEQALLGLDQDSALDQRRLLIGEVGPVGFALAHADRPACRSTAPRGGQQVLDCN